MNEHSSRSHTVVTLNITLVRANDPERLSETRSKLHLVDLSERSGKAGTKGERLKEGAHINLSLSALGNVFNALACGHNPNIPYRGSKLARLLQDSLGGNSVAVMLLNLSPAKASCAESLSALRFGERAKLVKNSATMNIDPVAAKAAELRLENIAEGQDREARGAHRGVGAVVLAPHTCANKGAG